MLARNPASYLLGHIPNQKKIMHDSSKGPRTPTKGIQSPDVSSNSDDSPVTACGGGSTKQRLPWTSDLHVRFVEAVTQLGGDDSK
jgi:hypothetical protein